MGWGILLELVSSCLTKDIINCQPQALSQRSPGTLLQASFVPTVPGVTASSHSSYLQVSSVSPFLPFSSPKLLQFSRLVVSDSLRPHGPQHARPPCPWPTPGAYSNSCPSSRWCHPTISSSVVPFSSCLQSFPASGSFPMSQFLTSGGQNYLTNSLY